MSKPTFPTRKSLQQVRRMRPNPSLNHRTRYGGPVSSNVRPHKMPSPQFEGLLLVHGGTHLPAVVTRAATLDTANPIDQNGGKYVLLVASEEKTPNLSVARARKWIEAGAAFVCTWGPSCQDLEELFDYAAFSPELGEPIPFTVMTTSHQNENLDEALWFAFYTAFAPEDLPSPLSSVVVLVDSVSLEARCTKWIETNHE